MGWFECVGAGAQQRGWLVRVLGVVARLRIRQTNAISLRVTRKVTSYRGDNKPSGQAFLDRGQKGVLIRERWDIAVV